MPEHMMRDPILNDPRSWADTANLRRDYRATPHQLYSYPLVEYAQVESASGPPSQSTRLMFATNQLTSARVTSCCAEEHRRALEKSG